MRFTLSFTVLAAFMGLAGCASAPRSATVEPAAAVAREPTVKPIIVGTSRTFPPIIYKRNGETIGLEADFAAALGEALGRPVELRPMLFADLLEEITYGRIDMIMAGMTVTRERKLAANFAEPYLVAGQQAMVRRADVDRLGMREKVLETDRRVGVERGTTAAAFARERLRNATVTEYDTVGEAISALTTRHIDVVIHDAPSVQWVLKVRGDRSLYAVPGLFTEEQLAWAVNKEDEKLLKQVNAVLSQWREAGKLEAMVRKWVPVSE